MEKIQELANRYIKIEEAAKAWEITARRVQILCAEGKIQGAVRIGREWLIPANASRPVDGRTRAAKEKAETQSLIDNE